MTIKNWYEVKADDEVVASFAPISREASTKAFQLVQDTQTGLYRNKSLYIVAMPDEEIIYETHPTRLDDNEAVGGDTPPAYDLFVM